MCRKDHPEGEYRVELRLLRQESGQLVHTEKGEGRQPYEAIRRTSLKAREILQSDNLDLGELEGEERLGTWEKKRDKEENGGNEEQDQVKFRRLHLRQRWHCTRLFAAGSGGAHHQW